MEWNMKKGEVYHIELGTDELPELKNLDDNYEAYMSWEFLPSGLPFIQDVRCKFGFEIASVSLFVDEWTCKCEENPEDVIVRYLDDAIETLVRRGVLADAIEMHQKELEEEFE